MHHHPAQLGPTSFAPVGLPTHPCRSPGDPMKTIASILYGLFAAALSLMVLVLGGE